MNNKYIRSSTPKLHKIILVFCGTFTILISVFYIVWVAYNGQMIYRLSRCLIFIIIIISFWFFLKILFYSVTASDKGIEAANIIGKKYMFLWGEIVEVRRPRFGFPVGFAYVISKNNEKMLLIRNKNNYKELIQFIKKMAPNLKICNP